MEDNSEPIRRVRIGELSTEATSRAELEERHGQVSDTEQLRNQFEVLGFAVRL